MRLNFSKHSPINATLTNESGEVLYIIKTPNKLFHIQTNIYHASSEPTSLSTSPNAEEWGEPGQPMMRLLAQIDFKAIHDALLRFGGFEEVKANKFFRKGEGFWSAARRKRYWNMPDGREFVWNYESLHTTLKRTNEEKTKIAQFHNISLKMTFGRAPVYLEIFPEGEDMIDWIVFTFVYIQELRQFEEGTASASAAAGASASAAAAAAAV